MKTYLRSRKRPTELERPIAVAIELTLIDLPTDLPSPNHMVAIPGILIVPIFPPAHALLIVTNRANYATPSSRRVDGEGRFPHRFGDDSVFLIHARI